MKYTTPNIPTDIHPNVKIDIVTETTEILDYLKDNEQYLEPGIYKYMLKGN